MIQFESIFNRYDDNTELWNKSESNFRSEIKENILFEGYVYKVVGIDKKTTKYKQIYLIITDNKI